MAYLLRVRLPDRPGALGAVATAMGAVGADILSVDVIDRTPNAAVDDLVVDLPPGKLPDTVVSAAAGVPGVQVESIRQYAEQNDPHRELELLDALAARPHDSERVLSEGVARIFRAGWALVLDHPRHTEARVAAASTAAPEIDAVSTPWWPPSPARALALDDGWAPPDWAKLDTEVAVAPHGGGALLVGRPAMPWLPSELLRLTHLAAIAATVTSATTPPQ